MRRYGGGAFGSHRIEKEESLCICEFNKMNKLYDRLAFLNKVLYDSRYGRNARK